MRQIRYKNLTELLLNEIRLKPGMYLGKNHISKLPNFILGYCFSDNISQRQPDFYFGDNGFLTWYRDRYKPKEMSFWHNYFLEEADNDDEKALEIFFERLEEYYVWYKQINK